MSLVVSLALHGVVLGALSFRTPDSTDSTADDRSNQSAFELPALEIVQIQETVVPPREVEVVSLRPVVTTPAPEPQPEPAAGMPKAAAGGESAAPAAATPVATEVVEVGIEARIALSMRPQFATQRSLPGTLQPLEAIDSHAGHDHEEDDGDDEGDSFWRRLGVPLGSGGGKICKPRRPPVVIHK